MKRRQAAPGAPEGGLVMDKAARLTSHDVVAVARRLLGQPRIGHTGTLDPLATGVLPLLLGRATRLAQFLAADTKAYEATVRFGQATSTYDADGTPVGPVVETAVDRPALDAALEQLRAQRLQLPPSVSAKRVGGHRAYDLARRDAAPSLAAVDVQLLSVSVTRSDGQSVDLQLECSAGFYVRSLAHDLGQILGVGGHLTALRRTRSGQFTLARAMSVQALSQAPESAAEHVWPMASLLPHLPAVVLGRLGQDYLSHGRQIGPGDTAGAPLPASGMARLLSESGHLLGLAECRAGALQPVVVLL